MFKVKAVENKAEQRLLSEKCNTEFIEKDFAYAAYDVASPNDETGEIIGVCQFTFSGGCHIHCLAPAEGKDADEAILILGFAVLEFLRRCKFTEITADIPREYALRLGFKNTDGAYILDLTAGRPCGGH